MSKHGIKIDALPESTNLPKWLTEWTKNNQQQFVVNAKTEGEKKTAEVLLYDVIGEGWWGGGVSASRFAEAIATLGEVDEIRVLINSPGGLVSDGMAIYNTLADHPAHVVTHVTGQAASAASFILQAGDERVMGETTSVFVHAAQGMTLGDDIVHRKMAEDLEKMTSTIAVTYARRSGRKAESFIKLMRDEATLTANEALSEKLIDRIVTAKKQPKNEREQAEPIPVALNKREGVTPETAIAAALGVTAVDVRLRLLELEAS